MFKVTFKLGEGEEKQIFAAEGETLLETARKANVVIDAPCSGNISCGKCRVLLLKGDVINEDSRHLSKEEYAKGWRLACASKVKEDVVVEVPELASAFQDRIKMSDVSSADNASFATVRKYMEEVGLDVFNGFKLVRLSLSEPTLEDTLPDNERIARALTEATGIPRIIIPFDVIKKLPDMLRDNDFEVECAVGIRNNRLILYDVAKQTGMPVCGVAIDIGTTTVSAVLVNMETGEILCRASAGNGQIRYGADIINRIIESTRPGGREKLQKAIIDDTINPMIERMCEQVKIPGYRVCRMCIASNTTMNHLFMGANADPLRKEPYIPAFFEVGEISAYSAGITYVNKVARIFFAPNIGSYVGGDITAGVLASMMWTQPELSLFIDLGTNGELVFGNSEFMMSCACSAGPAFEGGDISNGMRATDGAIEECTIDKETMEPTLKVVGDVAPIGICGSGLIDIISELYSCGIIDSRGKFVREGKRILRDEVGMGSYIIAFREDARDVTISEVDIDNFIRAKGAIFSAINIMLESLGFDVSQLDKVIVAGGIGSSINMKNAVNIGMLPDIDLEKYRFIGNSSLIGAYEMLCSCKAGIKVRELGRNMTYLELSADPKYMDEFVAACFIPHTNSELFPSVKLR